MTRRTGKPSDKRYGYRVSEVADMLGCSVRHIRRLIDDGTLRVVRLNHVVVVPAAELDRLMAGGDAA